jgi:tRNA(His) guanylyltransferase
MIQTCVDLLGAWPAASLAYTQSDEITLVFPNRVGQFNDRAMKITTLAAGFFSIHFYSHLIAAISETLEPAAKGYGGNESQTSDLPSLPYFDGRIFNVPSIEECLNNVMWRCRGDAVWNSISAFARTLFSTKEIHGKQTHEMLDMAKEKGVVYEDTVPKWALEGSTLKRVLVQIDAVDFKTGEKTVATKTKIKCENVGFKQFSEESLSLITDRYWPNSVEPTRH